jgi:outer membrane protein
MSLRSTLAVAAAALTLALPVAASAQGVKFGYVDFRRILEEVEDGKAADTRLSKWHSDRQAELKAAKAELFKELELLQKQGSAMNQDVFKKRQQDLVVKDAELAQKEQRLNLEAMARQQSEMDPITAKVRQVVEGLAKRDGLAFVLEKQEAGLFYAQSQFDLTNEVIRAYNALPKLSAPPPPKLPDLAKLAPTAKDAPMAKDAPVAKDAPAAKDAPKK